MGVPGYRLSRRGEVRIPVESGETGTSGRNGITRPGAIPPSKIARLPEAVFQRWGGSFLPVFSFPEFGNRLFGDGDRPAKLNLIRSRTGKLSLIE